MRFKHSWMRTSVPVDRGRWDAFDGGEGGTPAFQAFLLVPCWFDGPVTLLQAPRTMRWVAFLFAAASLTCSAPAQTNTVPKRSITLDQAIQLAVQHNLDLQIERYNPQIALYDVNAAYAGYEPGFNFSGQHSYNESVEQLLSGSFTVPGSIRESDSFRAGIGGEGGGAALTPWGMTYSLDGGVTDSYGKSFRTIVQTDDFGNVTTNTIPIPFENSVGDISLDVRQPLLRGFLIDGTRYNIRVTKNRLKWTEFGLKQQLLSVITQTEQAYYSLIAAREHVLTQEKAVELATRLLMENRKRVEVGALAPLDEKQAESQTASRRADLIEANSLLAQAEDRLKGLITDKYAEWALVEVVPAEGLTAPKVFMDRQSSWLKALTDRPDIMQAKLDLERAGIALKYAKNQLLPQLDVFGTFGYNGGGSEFSRTFESLAVFDKPFYSYGAQVSVPLGNRRARNNLYATRAGQEQAVMRLKQLEQQIMVQIDDAIKVAQSNYERIQAATAAREFSEAALDAEQKKLESGKSTNFQVLELQERLISARSVETQALATYNRALAQLRLLEGSTLEKHKIDFEAK